MAKRGRPNPPSPVDRVTKPTPPASGSLRLPRAPGAHSTPRGVQGSTEQVAVSARGAPGDRYASTEARVPQTVSVAPNESNATLRSARGLAQSAAPSLQHRQQWTAVSRAWSAVRHARAEEHLVRSAPANVLAIAAAHITSHCDGAQEEAFGAGASKHTKGQRRYDLNKALKYLSQAMVEQVVGVDMTHL
eukprot:COSAG05_NODE_529_length_8913_cov_14.963921_3_plen_190_part_00